MHQVLVNRLGGVSLPRKSLVRLTDHLDMTLDVYCGRKTTTQQQQGLTVLPVLVGRVGTFTPYCKAVLVPVLQMSGVLIIILKFCVSL